jgi:hypothetical protein
MPPKTDHIPLEVLWEHHVQNVKLALDEFKHICTCDECLALLGICQMAKTLKQAEKFNQERLERRCA